MISNIVYVVCAILVGLGLLTIIMKRNLIKMIIGVELIESGVNLFLISAGYVNNGVSPIFTSNPGGAMVMPTPQALTLTSIVIGLATTALMLSFAVAIYKHFGTLDIKSFRGLSK